MEKFADFTVLARELVRVGRFYHKRGWVPATSGSFSARLDENHAAVTVSGRHKGKLKKGGIVIVNLAGQPLTEGLFYIHAGPNVYGGLCEKGDLVSVPANIAHWFDMGPRPDFKCIRLFTSPEGWVANFTGSAIASRFPRLEA